MDSCLNVHYICDQQKVTPSYLISQTGAKLRKRNSKYIVSDPKLVLYWAFIIFMARGKGKRKLFLLLFIDKLRE